jgi:hypothetical protein
VWGDVPFSEFDKWKEGLRQPKFDDDATIYPELIKMLDEGITDIKSTTAKNLLKPGPNDVIYKGSTAGGLKRQIPSN